MADDNAVNLMQLTAEIVSAHVANNAVHTSDLPKLISNVHAALADLGGVEEAPAPEETHKPAVSLRKSLSNDDYIVSMIDGKRYKTLRRHLATHGLTDKDYRERYKLPADYPMVSKTYSAARAAMARTIGLGRKAGQALDKAAEAIEAKVEAPPAKRARKAATSRKPKAQAEA